MEPLEISYHKAAGTVTLHVDDFMDLLANQKAKPVPSDGPNVLDPTNKHKAFCACDVCKNR